MNCQIIFARRQPQHVLASAGQGSSSQAGGMLAPLFLSKPSRAGQPLRPVGLNMPRAAPLQDILPQLQGRSPSPQS